MASDNEACCESDPNFAVICGFLEKFGVTCGLANIDFIDLQYMLENSQEVPQELIDLHVKLLRKARKSVSSERWERAVIKFCHGFCSQDAWEIERFGYKKARLSSKLRILKELLEMQFDYNAKFKTEVNKLSAEELRTQPLGKDRLGHVYWYQSDETCQIRVYKEDPDEETWALVVKNRDDLVTLITDLNDGRETVLNEDSNSLESEKPIIDTGQTDSNSDSSKPDRVQKVEESPEESSSESKEMNENVTKKVESEEEEEEELKATESTEAIDLKVKESQQSKNDIVEVEEKTNTPTAVLSPPKTGINLRIKPIGELLSTSTAGIKEKYIRSEPSSILSFVHHRKAVDSAGFDVHANYLKRPLSEVEDDEVPAYIKRSRLDRPTLLGNKKKKPYSEEEEDEEEEDADEEEEDEVSDEIEEPLMLVKGEGSGHDNKLGNIRLTVQAEPIVSEEIVEEVIYFHGVGNGVDCETGNDNKDAESQSSTHKTVDKLQQANEMDSINQDEPSTSAQDSSLVTSKTEFKLGTIIDVRTNNLSSPLTSPIKRSRWDIGKPSETVSVESQSVVTETKKLFECSNVDNSVKQSINMFSDFQDTSSLKVNKFVTKLEHIEKEHFVLLEPKRSMFFFGPGSLTVKPPSVSFKIGESGSATSSKKVPETDFLSKNSELQENEDSQASQKVVHLSQTANIPAETLLNEESISCNLKDKLPENAEVIEKVESKELPETAASDEVKDSKYTTEEPADDQNLVQKSVDTDHATQTTSDVPEMIEDSINTNESLTSEDAIKIDELSKETLIEQLPLQSDKLLEESSSTEVCREVPLTTEESAGASNMATSMNTEEKSESDGLFDTPLDATEKSEFLESENKLLDVVENFKDEKSLEKGTLDAINNKSCDLSEEKDETGKLQQMIIGSDVTNASHDGGIITYASVPTLLDLEKPEQKLTSEDTLLESKSEDNFSPAKSPKKSFLIDKILDDTKKTETVTNDEVSKEGAFKDITSIELSENALLEQCDNELKVDLCKNPLLESDDGAEKVLCDVVDKSNVGTQEVDKFKISDTYSETFVDDVLEEETPLEVREKSQNILKDEPIKLDDKGSTDAKIKDQNKLDLSSTNAPEMPNTPQVLATNEQIINEATSQKDSILDKAENISISNSSDHKHSSDDSKTETALDDHKSGDLQTDNETLSEESEKSTKHVDAFMECKPKIQVESVSEEFNKEETQKTDSLSLISSKNKETVDSNATKDVLSTDQLNFVSSNPENAQASILHENDENPDIVNDELAEKSNSAEIDVNIVLPGNQPHLENSLKLLETEELNSTEVTQPEIVASCNSSSQKNILKETTLSSEELNLTENVQADNQKEIADASGNNIHVSSEELNTTADVQSENEKEIADVPENDIHISSGQLNATEDVQFEIEKEITDVPENDIHVSSGELNATEDVKTENQKEIVDASKKDIHISSEELNPIEDVQSESKKEIADIPANDIHLNSTETKQTEEVESLNSGSLIEIAREISEDLQPEVVESISLDSEKEVIKRTNVNSEKLMSTDVKSDISKAVSSVSKEKVKANYKPTESVQSESLIASPSEVVNTPKESNSEKLKPTQNVQFEITKLKPVDVQSKISKAVQIVSKEKVKVNYEPTESVQSESLIASPSEVVNAPKEETNSEELKLTQNVQSKISKAVPSVSKGKAKTNLEPTQSVQSETLIASQTEVVIAPKKETTSEKLKPTQNVQSEITKLKPVDVQSEISKAVPSVSKEKVKVNYKPTESVQSESLIASPPEVVDAPKESLIASLPEVVEELKLTQNVQSEIAKLKPADVESDISKAVSSVSKEKAKPNYKPTESVQSESLIASRTEVVTSLKEGTSSEELKPTQNVQSEISKLKPADVQSEISKAVPSVSKEKNKTNFEPTQRLQSETLIASQTEVVNAPKKETNLEKLKPTQNVQSEISKLKPADVQSDISKAVPSVSKEKVKVNYEPTKSLQSETLIASKTEVVNALKEEANSEVLKPTRNVESEIAEKEVTDLSKRTSLRKPESGSGEGVKAVPLKKEEKKLKHSKDHHPEQPLGANLQDTSLEVSHVTKSKKRKSSVQLNPKSNVSLQAERKKEAPEENDKGIQDVDKKLQKTTKDVLDLEVKSSKESKNVNVPAVCTVSIENNPEILDLACKAKLRDEVTNPKFMDEPTSSPKKLKRNAPVVLDAGKISNESNTGGNREVEPSKHKSTKHVDVPDKSSIETVTIEIKEKSVEVDEAKAHSPDIQVTRRSTRRTRSNTFDKRTVENKKESTPTKLEENKNIKKAKKSVEKDSPKQPTKVESVSGEINKTETGKPKEIGEPSTRELKKAKKSVEKDSPKQLTKVESESSETSKTETGKPKEIGEPPTRELKKVKKSVEKDSPKQSIKGESESRETNKIETGKLSEISEPPLTRELKKAKKSVEKDSSKQPTKVESESSETNKTETSNELKEPATKELKKGKKSVEKDPPKQSNKAESESSESNKSETDKTNEIGELPTRDLKKARKSVEKDSQKQTTKVENETSETNKTETSKASEIDEPPTRELRSRRSFPPTVKKAKAPAKASNAAKKVTKEEDKSKSDDKIVSRSTRSHSQKGTPNKPVDLPELEKQITKAEVRPMKKFKMSESVENSPEKSESSKPNEEPTVEDTPSPPRMRKTSARLRRNANQVKKEEKSKTVEKPKVVEEDAEAKKAEDAKEESEIVEESKEQAEIDGSKLIPVVEPLCVEKKVPLLTVIDINTLKEPDSANEVETPQVPNVQIIDSDESDDDHNFGQDDNVDVDDDSDSVIIVPEDDPLAGTEPEIETSKPAMTLATFKLDVDDSPTPSPIRVTRKRAAQQSVDALRENQRKSKRPQLEKKDDDSKRPKLKPKRSVDLNLRRSIEQQKLKEVSSSEDDNAGSVPKSKNSEEGASVSKRRSSTRSLKAVESDSEIPKVENPPSADKKTKKTKRILLGLEISPEMENLLKDDTPVRQSRRIAQIKIKEEAERRKLEEVTLNDLKEEQRKRKVKKDVDKDYKLEKRKRNKASPTEDETTNDAIESDEKKKRKRKRKHWNPHKQFDVFKAWNSSSGSSSSEVEDEEEEIEDDDDHHVVLKSDHEFSPESDLEEGTEVQPLKRARTARKESDAEEEEVDDCACQKCGQKDHPEWILLCDSCDSGWHCSCLRPALLVIPEGDWFCPPCQHITLVKKLESQLLDYDKKMNKREMEIRRKERLAYVGISLDNVLPSKEPDEHHRHKSKHHEEAQPNPATENYTEESGSDDSDSESESSSSTESDSDEPVYQLRERRQAHSYRFNDYDELINSAIQEELEAVKGAGNQGRGKDIATIVNATQEETTAELAQTKVDDPQEANINSEPTNQVEAPVATVEPEQIEPEPLPPVVPLDTNIKSPEQDSEEEIIRPVKKKLFGKKKHRKLNSLDVSSGDDDADSDEDFKGNSSSESEEGEEEYSVSESSDESRRGKRRKGSGPIRRSTRARVSRYDKDFINDTDSGEEAPRRKKTRSIWDESESEESDGSWGGKGRRKPKRVSRKKPSMPSSDKPRKSKKKKKRTGEDSDPEVFKKRPNIKFGGLNDDEDVGRRTRGKKINYLEALGSDSEDEMRRKPPRIEESEEEYIVQEDEEFKRKIENEKDSDESGPDAVLQDLAQMPHAKPKSRGRGKCGLKLPRKPKPGSEVSDMFSSVPTPAFHHSSDVFPPVSSDMFQSASFPPGPSDMFSTPPELYHNAAGVYPMNQQPPPLMDPGNPMQPTGYLMNQQILSNPHIRNQELHDIDDEPNPIEQINKNVEQMNEQEMEKMMEEEDYANKQLQLVALQLEKEKKRKEKEAQRLESVIQVEQKIPKKRGRKPKNVSLSGSDLVSPYNDSSCLPMNSMMANNAELSEPPGISLPMFSEIVPALNADGTPRKRRGRGKGKKTLAAEAAALVTGKDGSELEGLDCPSSSNSNTVSPAPDSPMHGSKLGIAAPPQPFSQSQPTPSVITRMLQSQSQPGAFSAKFFTSSGGDPAGPGPYHLGASGPRGLIPPGAYQQPPPGLPHYGVVRGAPPPLGIHPSGGPPPGLPPMYHAHRTLDPSPSGGGAITVSTSSRDRHSPSVASPSSSSPISKGEPTPPPPPYTRPQVGHFPPVSGSNASIPLSGSRHVSMIPPPHLQHRSGSGSLSSPYHPGVPPNYHYGTYPPPSAHPPPPSSHPPIGGDENQSPAVYPSAPYSENFIGDNGVPIPPSENSSGKPFEDDMGGEFVGLVSYFSSQREDDLDT